MTSDAASINESHQDYLRIEEAIRYLYACPPNTPLNDIAQHIGLSEFHFQRLFTRWAGITPKRFLQFITKEHALSIIHSQYSIEESALSLGLSGPSRLYDLCVHCEGVTPGKIKTSGQGMEIQYGLHPSPFGTCFIATTPKGICHLSFTENQDEALSELQTRWINATLVHDTTTTQSLINTIFSMAWDKPQTLSVHLKGTNFQLKDWQALLSVPPGSLTHYQGLATLAGNPNSSRAVGTAMANNSIAYLIPCHRVIQKGGSIGNYRWLPERKAAMIAWESAHQFNDN
jgi:AraC family transcriptional regulator of adaptative response/methylated-DNA-[protein]-cysteine methyltransferase